MFLKKIETFIAIIHTKLIRVKSGNKSRIYKPIQIDNPSNICLKNNVKIYHYSWLMGPSISKTGLVIDDGTVIGHFSHIIAYKNVYIGKNVLCADRVFISDCNHEYRDINIPIIAQGIIETRDVIIGDDSWLGENVCVCGASIGKHCVIGANSVVTKDIPDYCVAVGIPARVIRRYDFELKKWIEVK